MFFVEVQGQMSNFKSLKRALFKTFLNLSSSLSANFGSYLLNSLVIKHSSPALFKKKTEEFIF